MVQAEVPPISSPTKPEPPSESKLIQQAVADMQLVAIDKDHNVAANLKKAESDFGQLRDFEGGNNSGKFIDAINDINRDLHGGSNYLPGLFITGLSSEGHITVFDNVNKVNAVFADSMGVVGPVGSAEQTNNSLYLDSQTPLSDGIISPFGVHQGAIGDCTFLAALSSLAVNNPKAIRDMIQDNGVQPDGTRTYTVTFPGDADNPVVVSAPTKYEVHEFAQDIDGLWSPVLEKAYRKHTGKELMDPGAPGSIAMQLLTGAEPKVYEFGKVTGKAEDAAADANALKNAKEQLEQAIKEDRCITIGSVPSDLTQPTGNDASGSAVLNMVTHHMYSVLSFNPNTDMVTLRNPWDFNKDVNGNPVFGGVVRLHLSDVLKDFNGLVISQSGTQAKQS